MPKILIADDDRIIHRIYKRILEYLGHDYVFCVNGLEAVEVIKRENIDLVILDYMMPEMDGYQACQAMRKLPNGINVPIIIVSGNDTQEDILKFLNAGANDYLIKPIKEAILIAKLKNFLKTSSLNKNELDIVRNKATIADRFKIVKVLGYGAHSVVFFAEDINNNNNPVALKLFNQHIGSEEIIKSFADTASKMQEATLLNVIDIIDYGQYNEHIYAVLEYANNGDLAKDLKQDHKLSEEKVLKIALDVAKAIQSLEKSNLMHLDIKPENILINNGVYKLADFGIMKEETNGTMAINAEIWSTTGYTSPESLMGGEIVTIKSDIYSLGITLYEAITGDNPFLSEKAAVSMYRQVNLVPPSLLNIEGRHSVELAVLLEMMLAKKPNDRPSPEELIKTLTYINDSYDHEKNIKLTYVEKSFSSKDETEEDQKIKNENIALATTKLQTETALPIKSDESIPAEIVVPNKRIQQLVQNKISKYAISIIAFIVIYYFIQLSIYLFSSNEPIYDFKGANAVVMCVKCKKKTIKPIIDITKAYCVDCGDKQWYAYRCMNCGKEFALDENQIYSGDDIDKYLYRCPYCQSINIEQIMPAK